MSIDPRRPTRTTPRYIRNGKLITERRQAGRYVHQDGRKFRRWVIEQIQSDTADGATIANPSGKNPNAGMWTYRPEDGTPDDIFYTLADAKRAMQIMIYGEYTTEEDYNR